MRHFISVLYLAAYLTTYAQADDDKKLSKKELIEQADYYFFKENFAKALELYNTILDHYPRNHYVQYHQYVAHHLTDGRGSDLSGLKEFEENEGHTDKFYNYWLGRIHYSRYEFELAEEHYKAFLELDVYRTREIIKESKDRLEQSTRAREFYLNANEYELEHLAEPINSAFADLSPAFFAGHEELLFVSSRPDLLNGELSHQGYRVFHTTRSDQSSWKKATPLSKIGVLGENNAKIEVVNNDGRLFLYQGNEVGGELLYSEPARENWTSPVSFDANLRDQKIESHFFINDDENLVLFSARNASGNLDIYQTKLDPEQGIWTEPAPIMGHANTDFDEDSPYLSHDGRTLYLSTNSPLAIGGFDIVKCDWNPETQSWSAPNNLGFPINSIDNEVNFQLNPDGISGFLSSDRLHGSGDYDIYYFHKQGRVMASGKVLNANTMEPIQDLRIDFHPVNYKDETFRTQTDRDGFYRKEIFTDEDFIVEISQNGQIIHSETLTSNHLELKKEFRQDFVVQLPELIAAKTDFTTLYDNSTKESSYESLGMLGNKFRAGQKAMLQNVYFDIHSSHLTQESDEVLNKLVSLLKESKELRIEIGGHTDNTGTIDINMKLSEDRAKSVKEFLISKGISAARLEAKGYGASQPLASNDDEKDGRELNRRIEVRVLD